jgi:spermidine synthase
MSVTSEILSSRSIGAPARTLPRALLIGVAASSCGALLLELALTRLFSVVLFYHFAFLAISIALLGLGSGGVFAYLCKQWLASFETRTLLAAFCAANALAVPVVLEVCLHLGVSLEFSRQNFIRLTAIYLVSAIPFFLTGVEFSVLFAREAEHIPRLYGADLAGGALACLLVVPLLNLLGGPNTVLCAGVLAAAAGAVWAASPGARRLSVALTAALVLLIAANYSGKLIDITQAKGKLRDRGWVEFARWNAISRVEVDRLQNAKVIVIDADASTYIMSADPTQWKQTVRETYLMASPPAIANALRPHGEYAIIGPGGGVDVLRALVSGSPSVTGIEINSIIANTIMRGRYADYAYHLYERPEVHIHVGDGRSFIHNSRQSFDVVQMTLVDTWASTGAGAFALSENNLYTVEAFREYFEHLKPDGLLAITRWEFHQPREALRVVSVAIEALHQVGVTDPARNFMVISKGQLDADGIPVAVLAKKSAFTAEEEAAARAHMDAYPDLTPIYMPSKFEPTPFSALITGNDPGAFARQYAYNVAPVRDNAPFFFFTLKLGQILGRHAGLDQGIDWKVNLGVAVLLMVLAISAAAVLAFLVVPLAVRGARGLHSVAPLFYFVAIGLGYILVEIAFIQRFVLFLGHPTYALTVVVFLLLLSSGAGSLASRRWRDKAGRSVLALAVIASTILVYVLALPWILDTLVGLPFAIKLAVSATLLAPLGFAMGMPFPSGLQALDRAQTGAARDNAVEWAWAMNAGSSVLGSVLAMVVAIQFGLNITLACGAGAYLAALLFSKTLRSAA